ncbi:hypothetical protein P152DRAFT_469331 [Eremomyces bilateralis CBS 781.70]|uniref:Chloride channel protein n=1 Tax=Eremomyces bilateralis CBS 781.70 TaxID=1392243 RepID=A0A6G1GFM9_9PEZI|nr:uncharacterized protein P152DRAFT_469331 [Eremomyces bilateralis CBS 781.70]KAF1816802.1 hypothetical protein P152DRAFT_469331 [Eremomyces bilateralis CBS 781.70]
MAGEQSSPNERTHLLGAHSDRTPRRNSRARESEVQSVVGSAVSKEEAALGQSIIGERLPYSEYTTIDWLHDIVKSSYRYRSLRPPLTTPTLRTRLDNILDLLTPWIAVALIGALTAIIAFLVDVAVAVVSDYKLGYCPWALTPREECASFRFWFTDKNIEQVDISRSGFWAAYAVYVTWALLFGVISSGLTMTTKKELPTASANEGGVKVPDTGSGETRTYNNKETGKIMYMAAGSGIPELKTILSGFQIPHILSFPILVVKAIGSIFAVATGMCLGKEGPFVHISGCVGNLVGERFEKFRENGRMMRELLSASCAAGLSVAFGAPIGGVLFSYEEISTYFPRKVLWRAFLCSMVAAVVLKELNPTGTGKLVLFETKFNATYEPLHYVIFVFLGVAGGIFGGIFCQANYLWSKWFRSFPVIKKYPVFECFLVVFATAVLQFPNPVLRETGDTIVERLLVDCSSGITYHEWICVHERQMESSSNWGYVAWLIYGTLVKLVLMIITFGLKVPSGVIIPALDGGAFFGRLVGQFVPDINPGIFAMVGAGAFLAGVSRMTISLCVIMFELTGELEFTLPNMIAILTAKFVADAISLESVYDLAQTVLGHPFLDNEHALQRVQHSTTPLTAAELMPPKQTMDEITIHVPRSNKVSLKLLNERLELLRRRGLHDAGLVLVQKHAGVDICQGYLAQAELAFGVEEMAPVYLSAEDTSYARTEIEIRLLGSAAELDEATESPTGTPVLDLTAFVDRTPLSLTANAPLEYAVEMFGKLGLRYLMLTEESTGALAGVVIKKRMVGYLDTLGHH